MWKPITDAQKTYGPWIVSDRLTVDQAVFFENMWLVANYGLLIAPTHYWDFGLDTPLPPPPKEGE